MLMRGRMVRGLIVSVILVGVFGGIVGCDSSDSESPASSVAGFNRATAVATPTISPADKDKAEKEATQAVDAWVKLVDAGMYPDAWEETTQSFKDSSIKVDWCNQTAALRNAMGPLLSRTVAKADYKSKVDKDPGGAYVTVRYDTAFKATDRGIEEVTMMRGKDGVWRSMGYYLAVKPSPPTPAKK